MAAGSAPAGVSVSSPRSMIVTLWALQGLLAAFFLPVAAGALLGHQYAVDVIASAGVGQWLRYLVGASLLVGAVGLLLPRVVVATAFSLELLLLGVVAIAPFPKAASPGWIAVLLMLLCSAIAWFRWAQYQSPIGRAKG